ncbi:MAG: phosphomannose isomerase type II C-terminal cupin domain [Deltaproteobacteria bacterium]|nr:phosphomannose isomerase type II C-terminal cupin domain [Deltaproteobacteria bacterium]
MNRTRQVPSEERRPWGGFLVLEDRATHKVKRIWVDPGRRLSYQRHSRRSEHWIIIEGKAEVTLDGRQILLGPGESVDIPLKAAHRIRNAGETTLTFIEVQRGDYFGEDDIERLEDDYGRVSPSRGDEIVGGIKDGG